MSDTADAKSHDEAGKDGKKKKAGGGFSNLLIVIIGMANFLAVAGVGAYLVYGPGHSAQAAAQAGAKPAAEGEEHAAAEGEGGGHGEGHEGGEAAAGGHGEGHGAASEAKGTSGEGGPLLALDPIVTNLSEPDSDRYLKVTVQLRITSEAAKPEVEAFIVPIRSQILMFFSSLNFSDLRGSEAKQTLQAKIKRLANETMPTSRVTQVYFTELVVQ